MVLVSFYTEVNTYVYASLLLKNSNFSLMFLRQFFLLQVWQETEEYIRSPTFQQVLNLYFVSIDSLKTYICLLSQNHSTQKAYILGRVPRMISYCILLHPPSYKFSRLETWAGPPLFKGLRTTQLKKKSEALK